MHFELGDGVLPTSQSYFDEQDLDLRQYRPTCIDEQDLADEFDDDLRQYRPTCSYVTVEAEIILQPQYSNPQDRKHCDYQPPRYSLLSFGESPQILAYSSNRPVQSEWFTEFSGGPAPVRDFGINSNISPEELPPHQPSVQIQLQPQPIVSKAKNMPIIFFKRLMNIVKIYRKYFNSGEVDFILEAKGSPIEKSRKLLLIPEFQKLVQEKFSEEYTKFEITLNKKPDSQASHYRTFYDKMWEFIDNPQHFKKWIPRPFPI